MTIELEPAINLEIKNLKSAKTFTTLEQLDKWVSTEIKFWNILNDIEPQSHTLKQTRNGQLSKLRTLEQHTNNAKDANDPNSYESAVRSIKNSLSDYTNGSILHSRSSEAKYVKKLLKDSEDVNRGYSVLRAFLNEPLNINQQPYINEYKFLNPGLIEATSFRMGLKTDISAEKEILDDLKSDFNGLISEVNQDQQNAREQHKLWASKMNKLHKEQANTFENGVIKNSEENLAKLERLYLEKLHLEAPVKYWNDKADSHKTASIIYSITFLLAVICIILTLCNIYSTIEPILSKATEQPITSIVIIGIPAFLVIWILRFIARLLLMNITLSTDARERAAMTETFLALMKDEDAKMENADRILILQALFRPSSINSGDDGAPPNWFDVLVNRLDTKK